MKRVSKILLVILSFIMIFYTFSNDFVYADDDTTVSSWELTEKFNANDWNPNAKERTKTRRWKVKRNWK